MLRIIVSLCVLCMAFSSAPLAASVVAEIKDMNRDAYFAIREVQRLGRVGEAAFYRLIEGITADSEVDDKEATFLSSISELGEGELVHVHGLNDERSNFVRVAFDRQFSTERKAVFAELARGENVRYWHWLRRWNQDNSVVLELYLQREQDPKWFDEFLQSQLKKDHAEAVAKRDSRRLEDLMQKMRGGYEVVERLSVEEEVDFREYAYAQFNTFAETTKDQLGEMRHYEFIKSLSQARESNQ